MSAHDSYFDLTVDYATRQIVIRGELDVTTAPCVAQAVAAFQRAGTADITVRLDAVQLLDADGVEAVVRALSAQHERGANLAVTTGANSGARQALTERGISPSG